MPIHNPDGLTVAEDLLAPTVDWTYQNRIIKVMSDAHPDVVRKAGYVLISNLNNYP